ncbi:MAG: carbohydrate ABC transporter permease [Bacteroidetes bacterium]|nr:carbohydrate ABC transporter permease [Bacteroidota bacterium]
MRTRKKTTIITEIFVWILSLIVIIPFVMVVLNSLKDRPGANMMLLTLPEKFYWSNYLKVIEEGGLIRSFLNSLLISVSSVFLSVFSASAVSYVLARRSTKQSKRIYYYFLIGLVAPLNMVTVIKTLQLFGLINTYLGISLLYSALLIPFSVFLFYGFINSVPRSLDESAVIDGASPLIVFTKIVFPLLKPVTVTVTVLNFMNAWNDFLIPLYVLNRTSKWPMTLAIYNFYGRRVSDWHLVFADIVLTITPVVIIYILGQKYIVSGMTAGSVKG